MLVSLWLWYWSSREQIMPQAAAASWKLAIMNLVFVVAAGTFVSAAALVLKKWFKHISFVGIWPWVVSLLLMASLKPGISFVRWLGVCMAITTVMAGVGWFMLRAKTSDRSLKRVGFAMTLCLLGSGVLILTLLHFGEFSPRYEVRADSKVALNSYSPPHAKHEFRTSYYGSSAYVKSKKAAVALTPDSVDMSAVIPAWSKERSKAWGFSPKNFPLNAKYWQPENANAPLVVIVHGNKSSVFDSEEGYDYIGENLAAQGYFVVSVDENFLNTSILDQNGGIPNINQARALLINEHIRYLLGQSSDANSPLHRAVKDSGISVIGHSRGGEAASIAAFFTTQTAVPEKLDLKLDYPFTIKNVIGLAPSEGQ